MSLHMPVETYRRASAYGEVGSIPLGESIELFLVPASAPKSIVCAVLFLAANWKK